MKLEKIELYKMMAEMVDGEFEVIQTDVETVPLVITNKALKYAHQNDIIQSSLISDLVTLSQMGEDMGALQDMKIFKTIYVAYVGGQFMLGNKEPKYNEEEFAERFQVSTMEQVTLYQKVLIGKENNFEKEIKKSVSKKVDKDAKK